ncbi:MAG: sensor histidine kinase, partial [Planktomarina sp.]
LQETANPGVKFVLDNQATKSDADIDPTLLGQAFTNLLKNAVEAIETKQGPAPDEVRVTISDSDRRFHITIADNGIGLPEDRAKLFEPYVTHRDGGTGLGLPIVMKIIEDHGGSLSLEDAPVFGPDQKPGAMASIVLPKAADQSELKLKSEKEVRYG